MKYGYFFSSNAQSVLCYAGKRSLVFLADTHSSIQITAVCFGPNWSSQTWHGPLQQQSRMNEDSSSSPSLSLLLCSGGSLLSWEMNACWCKKRARDRKRERLSVCILKSLSICDFAWDQFEVLKKIDSFKFNISLEVPMDVMLGHLLQRMTQRSKNAARKKLI